MGIIAWFIKCLQGGYNGERHAIVYRNGKFECKKKGWK